MREGCKVVEENRLMKNDCRCMYAGLSESNSMEVDGHNNRDLSRLDGRLCRQRVANRRKTGSTRQLVINDWSVPF